MNCDSLGDRMKSYENIPRIALETKQPVIIRLDGKAFHTFTKGMYRPFDNILSNAMYRTAQHLCANVMNCKMAYTQSDEISLLLIDYERPESQAWFENSLQKMVSVAASIATLEFNRAFRDIVNEAICAGYLNDKQCDLYLSKIDRAMFDARAFSLPVHEVCNYFIWRQQDAMRNSVQMVARSLFSHKVLQNKNTEELKAMILNEHGISFYHDVPINYARGACIIKEYYEYNGAMRSRWVVDKAIPVFTKDRNYINQYVFVGGVANEHVDVCERCD